MFKRMFDEHHKTTDETCIPTAEKRQRRGLFPTVDFLHLITVFGAGITERFV